MTQLALVRVPEPLGPDEQSVQEDWSTLCMKSRLRLFQRWSFLVCRDDDTTCLGSCSGAFGPWWTKCSGGLKHSVHEIASSFVPTLVFPCMQRWWHNLPWFVFRSLWALMNKVFRRTEALCAWNRVFVEQSVQEDWSTLCMKSRLCLFQRWSFLVCRDDDTTCLGSCSGAFGPWWTKCSGGLKHSVHEIASSFVPRLVFPCIQRWWHNLPWFVFRSLWALMNKVFRRTEALCAWNRVFVCSKVGLSLYTEMMTQLALVRVPEPLGPDEQSVQEDWSTLCMKSRLVYRDDDTTSLGSCSGAFRPWWTKCSGGLKHSVHEIASSFVPTLVFPCMQRWWHNLPWFVFRSLWALMNKVFRRTDALCANPLCVWACLCVFVDGFRSAGVVWSWIYTRYFV